jgi:hypothetical protein
LAAVTRTSSVRRARPSSRACTPSASRLNRIVETQAGVRPRSTSWPTANSPAASERRSASSASVPTWTGPPPSMRSRRATASAPWATPATDVAARSRRTARRRSIRERAREPPAGDRRDRSQPAMVHLVRATNRSYDRPTAPGASRGPWRGRGMRRASSVASAPRGRKGHPPARAGCRCCGRLPSRGLDRAPAEHPGPARGSTPGYGRWECSLSRTAWVRWCPRRPGAGPRAPPPPARRVPVHGPT